MNKSLLDTDTLSEITKGINPAVAARANAYRRLFHRCTISSVTFMEAVRGYHRKQAAKQLQAFLAAMASEEVIAFDRPAVDPMIAAIALLHGLDLVTGNTAHYRRIQQLGYPLAVINWR